MKNQELVDEAVLLELVRRAQEGNTEAFGRVYDMFFVQVYRYTAFRVPEEIAEDLVADIFVKAWEKLHTYRARKNVPFGAWLFRIARHTVIDSYRTHRGFEEVPETVVDDDVLNRADTKVRRDDLLQTVNAALNSLPERYREVLLLTFMAELPHSEVARVLHLSEGAVRILKFRALKKLEKELPTDVVEYIPLYSS